MKKLLWGNSLQSKFFGFFCMYSLLILVAVFSSEDSIRVPVKPSFTSPNYTSNIDTINNYAVEYTGNLVIKKPNLIQRLLLPQDFTMFSFNKIFPLWFYSLFVVLLLPKIQPPNTFKKDASLAIKILGFTIIGFYIIEIFLHFYYIHPTIQKLSNGELIPFNNIDVLDGIFFWIGFVLIKLSNVFKTGYELQQEKELTI